MFFARERVRSWSEKGRSWGWPVEKEKRSGARLQDLLQAAYEDVKKEDGIVAGAFSLASSSSSVAFVCTRARTDSCWFRWVAQARQRLASSR